MYFDNIGNAELNKLPKEYMPNFSIKLSVVLAHDLFKVEEIVSDKIYRIYPLFNCKEITSSNPNDKIFENRLIICTKQTTETYLTFISHENEAVQDFNDMGSYFNIGDGLTTAQYNDIVQLERMYNTIKQPLHIQSDLITNDYGFFDFKFTGLILDNGIAISSLTNLKVKLSNPAFSHSTYTLQLKVLRIDNTNIEEAAENKIIIPITVTLKNGKYVNIPVDDLQVGDVILFDCDLIITHDIPTLNVVVLDTIDFSASKTIATAGETISFTATLYDNKGIEMPDVPVVFSVYQNGSVIDTITGDTGSDGSITEQYTCAGGNISVIASAYNMDSEAIDITVNTISTTLSINVPALIYSDVFDVTGVLKDGSNNTISGASVKLYMEHNGETTLQATETTNNSGEVTFHRSAPTSITHYKFWLVFDGTALYSATQSGYEERDVGKETSVLTVTLPADNSSYPFGVNVGVMGTLLSNDGEAISNASIVISENDTTLTTVTTGNDGGFSGNISGLAAGSHTLKFTYAGDSYYTACILDNRHITINDVASVLLQTDKSILSYVDHESATLTATCLDGASNPVQGVSVSFDIVDPDTGTVISNIGTATTDSSGECSVSYLSNDVGDLYICASCNGILSIQTYVEDCDKYDTLTSNNNIFTLSGGNATVNYSNSGLSFKVTQMARDVFYLYNGTLPTNYRLEIDVNSLEYDTANISGAVYVNNASIMFINRGATLRIATTEGNFEYTAPTIPYTLKVDVYGTQISVYIDDNLLKTVNLTRTALGFAGVYTRGITAKNLKIKKLQ